MLELSEWKERKSILATANENMKLEEISLTPMLQLTSPVLLMMNEPNEEPREEDQENELAKPKENKPRELKLN